MSEVSAMRSPDQVVTWRTYRATKSEICTALMIQASMHASVELELDSDGLQITVKEAK